MEYRTISVKLTRKEFNEFKAICERRGKTFNFLVRELIKREVTSPFKEHRAGENIIKYNREVDNFSWSIKLDDGDEMEILENLSFEYIKDLKDKIDGKTRERDNMINKNKEGSVAILGKILQKGL